MVFFISESRAHVFGDGVDMPTLEEPRSTFQKKLVGQQHRVLFGGLSWTKRSTREGAVKESHSPTLRHSSGAVLFCSSCHRELSWHCDEDEEAETLNALR